jgi:triacylglycerol esterase/lipase EstA (alpha/beta hydrolase family)
MMYERHIVLPSYVIRYVPGRLIVLVHGRGGRPEDFNPLKKNLKKLGVKSYMKSIDLGYNRHTSVVQDAELLGQKMDELVEYYKPESVVLVGLSKGGLVCSYYALHNQTLSALPVPLTKVITISSPLRGTRVAGLIPNDKSVTKQELSYRSDFVERLSDKARRHQKKPLGFKFYHLVPAWDHLIVPTSAGAYPSTPTSQMYRYNGLIGHIGITFSYAVAKQVHAWLES